MARMEQMGRVISIEAIWRPRFLADRLEGLFEGLSGTWPRLEQSWLDWKSWLGYAAHMTS